MIKLKQILFYDNFSGAEVTWVDETTLPQQEIEPGAASLALKTQEIAIKCHSYAASQMDMLRADALQLGTPLDDYETQIAEIEAAYVPPDPEPIQVLQVITIRQAKLALLQAGLLDDVDAAVAQADRATQIEWEYATEVRRDWPTLLTLQTALGLPDQQVDDLFISASLI